MSTPVRYSMYMHILYVSAMVVLLNHINLPEVTIAVDGSLYEHHPKYHDHMMDVLRKWVPNTKVSCFIIPQPCPL